MESVKRTLRMSRYENLLEPVDDSTVRLKLRCMDWRESGIEWRWVYFDAADAELVLGAVRGRWYANGTGKYRRIYYANAKRERKTLLMHRVIMEPPAGREVHHVDGDGLNNRRSNLYVLTHKENIALRYDARPIFTDAMLAEQRRREEHQIAMALGAKYSLTRQQMWHIRKGYTRTSPAAVEYRTLMGLT